MTNQSQEPLTKRKRSPGKVTRPSAEVRPAENGTAQIGEAELLEQYGCGPVQFSGSGNASYERHLLFDNVMPLRSAGARERFEALARSVRDLLSQRWVRTEAHYARKNPKRVYYLSMEYLVGRSLANNLTNLLLVPFVTRVLYPDDSTSFGQGLRFIQEYFLVACSLGDLVRRFRQTNDDWSRLPEKVAIQLNDTHPSMAVPELMRLLLDEAHLS